MLPYWLLFSVVAWLAISRLQPVTNPTSRWPGLWRVMFVVLVLMIGLRHEVGGDWAHYVRYIEYGQYEAFFSKGDPAYLLLNSIAADLGGGVYLVNTVCAVFFCTGLVYFCRAQPRPWLALIVAVPYLITVVAMGYTRQAAALGFVMLGLVALTQGRTLYYVGLIAVAATFHKSAVVLMPLAVFAGTRHRVLTALWVGVSGMVCYSLLLSESVNALNTNYILAQYQSGGAGVRVAMNAVPAVLFLWFRGRFEMPDPDRKFWTWMSLGGLAFIVWLVLSPSSTAVDRMALYWIPLQLFVLSRLPEAMSKTRKLGVVVAIVAYSAAAQFTWLQYATNAIYWLPYKFYPLVVMWQ